MARGGRVRWWIVRVVERGGNALMLHELPHGFSACHDITRRKPDVRTVIDVGANVGQSANVFASIWPKARIFSVEPVASTFEKLVANTSANDRIVCVQCGFAAAPGSARMALHRGSQNNSVILDRDTSEADTEVVRLTTLDEFCGEHGVQHVDFLKIDTEGHDMQVLEGARRLLEEQRISFIQVEAGMNPHNTKHVPLAQLQRFLGTFGYTLFGIYDQMPEWTGQARLRFANPVFISESDSHLPPTRTAINATRAAVPKRHRRPAR